MLTSLQRSCELPLSKRISEYFSLLLFGEIYLHFIDIPGHDPSRQSYVQKTELGVLFSSYRSLKLTD